MMLPLRTLVLFAASVLTMVGCEINHRGDPAGPDYPCRVSTDCAEGCYCDNGICQEAGFCANPGDCGSGFQCNTDRSSCEPIPPGCKDNSGCDQAAGELCDVPTGTCTKGSCAGAITCTTAAPTCPSGSSPLIFNGCYTGSCQPTTACTESPTCEHVNDETNCLNRNADCTTVYVGLNCTNMQTGQACHSGDSGCLCESFQFDHCKTTNPAPTM